MSYVSADEVAGLEFSAGIGDGDGVIGEYGAGDLEGLASDGGILRGGKRTCMMVTAPLKALGASKVLYFLKTSTKGCCHSPTFSIQTHKFKL